MTSNLICLTSDNKPYYKGIISLTHTIFINVIYTWW